MPAGVSPDPLLHLLRRTTYGLTPELVAEARSMGASAWLAQQLQPASIEDRACEELVSRFPLVAQSGQQVDAQLSEGSWDVMFELGRASLARACWSRRQLQEVMVEFWSNHLHITSPAGDVWATKHVDDREVIRRHALGRFSEMLVASAKSPAMLLYLNNASSDKTNPNENYGRELLELHTVGVDGGYTEADVKQSTLALTGWSVNWDSWLFEYKARKHHVGPLQVMGWSHANSTAEGGVAVGESYLRYLATHPATARHIARKLCVRFVSDQPPSSLVERLAQIYLASGSAITPMLQALLTSSEFASSIAQKEKRPLEHLTSTIRALGITPDVSGTKGVEGLYWMSGDLGQAPLAWHPPNGYPDVAPAWRSAASTLGVWNMHLGLASGWWPRELGYPGAQSYLGGRQPASVGELVDLLSQRLLGQLLPASQREQVVSVSGKTAASVPSSSDLGWRLPYLVATVLDTPAGSRR